MIAVDVLVVVALFLYKVTSYQPNAQYYQLLVNYDHGLIRRQGNRVKKSVTKA